MRKRLVHSTLWFKALALGLVFAGLTEKSAALISGGAGMFFCAFQIRAGIKEQYWEPPNHQRARLWEDLVWGHSYWINPNESPEQGIERLAGPFLKEGK